MRIRPAGRHGTEGGHRAHDKIHPLPGCVLAYPIPEPAAQTPPLRMPLRTGSLAFTLVLGVLIALLPLTLDIYMPAMPVLVSALNSTVPGVQFTLAAFIAGVAIGQIAYGPLSDRDGRRPVLIAGLALYAASSAACAWSESAR